jgi:preprotein translocase subunit Sss1
MLAAMTIENILLYVGIGLIVFGFVSYLICMYMERYYDRKLYELQQKFKK